MNVDTMDSTGLTDDQRRQRLIDQIDGFVGALEELVGGLSRTQLDKPWRQGGWTVRQIVHHLVDSHVNIYIRMKLTLTEDHPTLTPYDQDLWAELPDAHRTGISASLALLRGLHARSVDLLRNLTTKDFERTSFHPEVGEMTMEDLMVSMAEHSTHHLQQIRILLHEKGWKPRIQQKTDDPMDNDDS